MTTADRTAEIRYPEHDKVRAIQSSSQAIGGFLDSSGYQLSRYVPPWVTFSEEDIIVLKNVSLDGDGFLYWERLDHWDSIHDSRMERILGELATGEAFGHRRSERRVPVVDDSDAIEARIAQVIEEGGFSDTTADLVLAEVYKPIETVLAEYFEIDQRKLEAEKLEMLATLREAKS